MSCDVVQRLDAEGHLRLSELSDLLNLQSCSGWRYAHGTELRYSQLRTLVRFAGSGGRRDEVVRGLVLPLLAGTGYTLVRANPKLDIDGDNDVDTTDAIRHSIQANKDMASIQTTLLDGLEVGTHLDPRDVDQLDVTVSRVIESALAVKQIAADVVARQSRVRRHARPLPTAPGNGTRGVSR